MKKINSYLRFDEIGQSASGKTKVWRVVSINSVLLGEIRWHARWRRYGLYPLPERLFDAKCLTEIAEFISTKTQEQKEG